MSLFKKPNRRLFMLGALSACGLKPVLNSNSYKELWGKVQLPDATSTDSFTMRRVLATYFGEPVNPIYRLKFEYKTKTSSIAITESGVVTRYRLIATGKYLAYRIGSDEPILDQEFKRIASYTASRDLFASDEAQKTTEERLIRALGDDFAFRFINATSSTSANGL